uniref:DOMON domain-containing protein n=1 Tax=Attheya septentrionalis TaxID=420275 RepID=A0A7S2UJ58_9STRA|mmetsp:Transcript_24735/g.44797  ORF Transcript_24735/g.44797 Transcript_24735/m.44797 type:complete len:537 (+) Transcript_24735:231-1841(+)
MKASIAGCIIAAVVGLCAITSSHANVLDPDDFRDERGVMLEPKYYAWSQVGGNVNVETNDFRESNFRVALSGDGSTMAVGAPLVNESQGAVRVTRLNQTSGKWELMGSDIVGDSPDNFAGASVSLSKDGTILAVGYPADIERAESGACCDRTFVRVFQWNSEQNDWEQLGADVLDVEIFFPPDQDFIFLTSQAGWTLSLSDDGMYMAIGAPNFFRMGKGYVGQVRVYNFVSSSNEWKQVGLPIEGDLSSNGNAGFSLAFSGDGTTLAVGDPFATNGTGIVRIFKWNDDWELYGNIIVGDEENDHAGFSISLSVNGKILAVGFPGHGPGGLVRVYQFRSDNNWDQVGTDIYPDPNMAFFLSPKNDGQTVSISANGLTLAIAAPGTVVNEGRVGLARVVRLNATLNDWEMVGNIIPCETRYTEDGYGTELVSLSADGKRLVVGAPMHSTCQETDFACLYAPQDYSTNWTGHVRAFDILEVESSDFFTIVDPIGEIFTTTAPTKSPTATAQLGKPTSAAPKKSSLFHFILLSVTFASLL